MRDDVVADGTTVLFDRGVLGSWTSCRTSSRKGEPMERVDALAQEVRQLREQMAPPAGRR
jgi:hypothetical protein